MLRVQSEYDDESLALSALSQENVFVHPAYFFDIEDETVLVVSLISPPKQFAEGVSRLLSCIDRLATQH